MKIVFWSPTPFSGRKSSNLLLMALQAVAEEGREQLIVHADESGSGPEHFLLSGRNRIRMMERKEFGVELLDKLLCCERFTKELAVNASYTFAEGRLHILPSGSRFFYQGREEKAAEAVTGIMKRAEEYFQTVWVEAPAGNSAFSEQLCRTADLVVVNLAQSPGEAAKIAQLPVYGKEFFFIGAHEKRCTYNRHNMMLLYPRLYGKCAAVPYQARYLAACCAGEAEAFWERGIHQGEEDVLYPFFKEVKKAYLSLKRCQEEGDA
ncbi:MAG: hypothetical protein ACI4QX_04695 [Lachnospiraceae bacterium]